MTFRLPYLKSSMSIANQNLNHKMNESKEIIYKELTSKYFKEVIVLALQVHGGGYLNLNQLIDWVSKGTHQNINSSFVALCGNKLIGFRITFSANNWLIDQWCTPELWQVPKDKCCYFKCNSVDENYRGLGIGKALLNLSIEAAIKQGAKAGISHLWKQSPKNSAVAYFSKCGGTLITTHPSKWNEDSKNGYNCTICGFDCHCDAVEMIIRFDDISDDNGVKS